MQGVLIDDHRIHVDFSQSVSKLSDSWRTATNSKRRQGGGGFGGVDGLERKRQYRKEDYSGAGKRDRYGMVYDEDELRRRHKNEGRKEDAEGERRRSRSPRKERSEYDGRDSERSGGQPRKSMKEDRRYDRDRYDDRDRTRGGRRDDYRSR